MPSTLVELKQRLLEAHETAKAKQAAYLALPLDDPGKAEAYLTLCAACRAELDLGDEITAEKDRLVAQA